VIIGTSEVFEKKKVMMLNDENAPPQVTNKKQAQTQGKSGGTVAAAGASKAKGQKTIEETYTKKTQLEHILLRPDTYGQ
jgi:hypothetical protein